MSARVLLAAALLLALRGAALAQDRPLLEPFRIGYAQTEPIAERMRASAALERALRRKGFVVSWRGFDGGLEAVRALHAEEVDLALDVSLHDVVAAKRENLKMVFIAELRSIAPSCCDLEELFADHIFKRYTLSSEYFADQREDVLLVVHEQIIKALQQGPERLAILDRHIGPIPVARFDRRYSATADRVGLVTRSSMEEVRSAVGMLLPDESSATTIDIADINYWLPQ
jgi:hypothetical protein